MVSLSDTTSQPVEITVGDSVFDGVVAGPSDGQPVLCLHGFPQTHRSWSPQLAALAEAGYRVLAPDQRGYSPRARPWSIDAYRSGELVGDVLGFIGWLGGGPVHLVGHDWGGAVAWQVAARHPQRLRSLTVVSTPHPRAFAKALQGWSQRVRSSYVALFRSPVAESVLVPAGALGLRLLLRLSGLRGREAAPYLQALGTRQALRGGLNWYRAADRSMLEGLEPISTPTLYVWGKWDLPLGPDAARATERHVVGPYRFEPLPKVSHWVPEQAPGTLNALLLEHLAANAAG
jgi:pimeloyl-ACP methyl ester carboxylesterase